MYELELIKLELDSILKSSNDNIVIADGDGIVLRSSPNCSDIYEKSTEFIIGKSVYELERRSIFKPSVTARVLKEKKEVQVMQETPNGKIVMATGIPIFDTHGNLIRVISFSHDLTELRQLKDDYEFLQTQMKYYKTEIEELRIKETQADGIVIKSKKIEEVISLINRIAKSDATVVLLGDSGVGKSMYARTIHNRSLRHKEAFIEVNSSAIPDTLFESEIFGYEPGSFTGANQGGKIGLIELADKGTLFFDEIADIPLNQQVKLLKVLEEKRIFRIGGKQHIDVDFRLIAATNRDLQKMVEKGTFREDLYYRLNVVPITIPTLQERVEDIFHLADYFLNTYNKKYQSNKTFHPKTIKAFQSYHWPGNVRELENLIERLVVTSESNIIKPSLLPFHTEISYFEDRDSESIKVFEQTNFTLKNALEEFEMYWLRRAYRQYKTTYEIAEALGISQATVVRRLKKYNIKDDKKRKR